MKEEICIDCYYSHVSYCVDDSGGVPDVYITCNEGAESCRKINTFKCNAFKINPWYRFWKNLP